MEELNRVLRKNLKDLRKKKGLTREKFAEQAGVSVKTIERCENGKCNPTVETVGVMVRNLGLSTGELFTSRKDDPPG